MVVSDRRAQPCVCLVVALGLVAGAWTVVLPTGVAAADVGLAAGTASTQLQPTEPDPGSPAVPVYRESGATMVAEDDAGGPTPTPDPSPAPGDTSSTPTSEPTGDPTETPADGGPSVLSLDASMTPSVVTQDELATIKITVHNDGPGEATAMSVTQTIPEGAVLQSHVKGLETSTGSWEIPELGPGMTATLEIPVTFPQSAGEVMTSPRVVTDDPDVDVIGSEETAVVAVLPAVPGGPSNGPPQPSGGGEPGSAVTPSYSGGTNPISPNEAGQAGGQQDDTGVGAPVRPDQSAGHDPASIDYAQSGSTGPSSTPAAPAPETAPDVGASTVTAESAARDVGGSSSRAALVSLGVALVVTGCVLLGVGAHRRRRLWG